MFPKNAIRHVWSIQNGPHDDAANIIALLVDDLHAINTSVPFLTDSSCEPKCYPLNDHFRTPRWNA